MTTASAPAVAQTAASSTRARWQLLGWLLLPALVVGAYAPGWSKDWIEWDDAEFVRDNPYLRDASGLRAIWFTRELPQYYPVTFTSHWVEYQLWGSDADGYYAVNIGLHAAAALLALAVARSLAFPFPVAWFAAAVFALHPLQVGSIAWLAERKNLLAGLFGLLTILLYVRYRRRGGAAVYAATLLAFLLAVLSKSVAVTVLPSLWLADVLVLRHRGWSTARPLILPAVLAVVPVIVTGERESALASDHVSLVARPLHAAQSLWFYVGKFVAPFTLTPVYRQWTSNAAAAPGWVALATAVAAVVLVVRGRARLGAGLVWGLGHFAVSILPALGLVFFGFLALSSVGDHLVYFALFGLALGAASAFAFLAGRANRTRCGLTLGLAASVLVGLGAKTALQTRLWRDAEVLWNHTLRHNPLSAAALGNLGAWHEKRGEHDAALECFSRAVAYAPGLAQARTNLGAVLLRRGRVREGLEHLRCAVDLDPGFVMARVNLATALLEVDVAAAEEHARAALARGPREALAHLAYGTARGLQGDLASARTHWELALEYNPGLGSAHASLAQLLALEGRTAEAAERYRAALALDPHHATARVLYGGLLTQQGDLASAAEQYRAVLEVQPEHAPAHRGLADVLVRQDRLAEGIGHLQAALRAVPDDPETHFMLAVALARSGARGEAVFHAQRAVELAPTNPQARRLLASLSSAAPTVPPSSQPASAHSP